MRIGMAFGDVRGPSPLPVITRQIHEAAAAGVRSAWISDGVGWDALTALAAVGPVPPGLELGTAVVPFPQRHPLLLARQVLTTQAALGHPLTLGIGAGIARMVETMYGFPTTRPAARLREYLEVLHPLLQGKPVDHHGEYYTAVAELTRPTAGPGAGADGVGLPAPSVLVAALGPVMLKVAGELAAGTVTWMTGPRTLGEHVVPVITRAAGGRVPRVVAGFAVCLTSDEDAVRARFGAEFALAGQVPEYRAMLDREGAAGPADVLLVGDEAAIAKQLDRIRDAGATDVMLAPIGTADEQRRTTEFLSTIGG
ncbi:TIGR03564 family F420-dependent LLM class oxidoreductase [Kribbella jejuensis]|uniref:F420-dependent oxidoreductase-like protein n=1 Tax=Kribbella jejuensis TaxID=236068 RepID=A0A542EQQ5_9ACTN|nr:TIGR03564 family F420-dependent LLM class oxidoreductase [Kribbella jejuensis]TQJ17687.1 F420-dependent oxidoreductase-like protein [Kribbella jejuensis]